MSIFSDLPAYPASLDSGHAAAAGLIHSWLFNKGSGTTVLDDVTSQNASFANGPTWDAGGGVNFGAYALLDVGAAGFAGVAAPWCIVAGVYANPMSGYKALFGPYSGNWIGLGLRATYVSGLTISSEYTDGVSGISGLADATPYVLAWRCSVGALAADCWLGNANAFQNFNGRIAFLYIFTGLDDTALAARALTLAGYPYQFYGGTQPPASNPWPDALVPKRPHMMVRR